MLRVVTPIGSRTWTTRGDLGRPLGSEYILHRLLAGSFWSIFVRGDASHETLDWVEAHLEDLGHGQTEYQGSTASFDIKMQIVSHPHPGTMAIFASGAYEERILDV